MCQCHRDEIATITQVLSRNDRPHAGNDESKRPNELSYRSCPEITVVQTDEPTKLVHALTGRALALGHEVEGLEVRRASLEDVYLDLVREPRE